LTVAREKNGRISIQQTSDSWVQHRRQSAANGLTCQTKCFAGAGFEPRESGRVTKRTDFRIQSTLAYKVLQSLGSCLRLRLWREAHTRLDGGRPEVPGIDWTGAFDQAAPCDDHEVKRILGTNRKTGVSSSHAPPHREHDFPSDLDPQRSRFQRRRL